MWDQWKETGIILYINKINDYYYLVLQWLLSWLWLLLKEAITQRLFEDVILTAHKHATLTVEPEVSSYKLIWCQWLIRQLTSLWSVNMITTEQDQAQIIYNSFQFPQRKKHCVFFVGCPICKLIKSPWSNVRASWPRLCVREREREWPTFINKQS